MLASTSKRTLQCRCLSSSSSILKPTARAVHTRPNLPYDISGGLKPFLSSQALRGTAVEWHQGNLNKLNDLIRGTQYENQDVAQTVVASAKDPLAALIFGHASEALNNGYFLAGLSPSSDTTPGGSVSEAIKSIFGSIPSFINHFSSFASGQFGSGYVWLAMDEVDNLAVMATYGSGTILVQGDHVRVKRLDQFVPVEEEDASATQAAESVLGSETERQPTREYENQASSRSPSTSQQTRSYHSSSTVSQPEEESTSKRPYSFSAGSAFVGGMGNSSTASQFPRRKAGERFTSIHPLLCLSLHPHVYIPDYGINGKDAYIENFWRNVNWEQIERRYQDVKSVMHRNKGSGYSSPSAFGPHRFNSFINRPRSENFNIS